MLRLKLRPSPLIGLILLVGLAMVAVVVIVSTSAPPKPSSALPALVHSYDESPNAFTFQYPDGWIYQIVQTGLMLVGEPNALSGGQGPVLTIQRSMNLMADTLAESMDSYLKQGPLARGKAWQQLGDVKSVRFDGKEALAVDVQGSEQPNLPPLRNHIVVTRAANTFVYVLVIGAPVAQWQQQEPLLESVLNSVKIVE
jgi:hypothetical protein